MSHDRKKASKMPKHNMKEYYSKRAPDYERIYYRDDQVRRDEIAEEVVRLKELVTDADVLELPVGSGYWTEFISETANSITASDLTPEMIKEAQKKNYNCQITYSIADINQLPFAQNSFDIITIGFWISHHPLENLQELFLNLKKLLRPNGKIWFMDNNPPAEQTHLTVGNDEHGNHYKKRVLDNGREYTIIKNYFTKKELTTLFSQSLEIKSINYAKHYWSVVTG